MAGSNLNEWLGFLGHPQGDIAMCKDAFHNDGLAVPILGGANNILPSMMSQQLLTASSRSDAAKIFQRAVHSLPSRDGENLKAYQDTGSLVKYDPKQYAYVASLKINEKDGVKGLGHFGTSGARACRGPGLGAGGPLGGAWPRVGVGEAAARPARPALRLSI